MSVVSVIIPTYNGKHKILKTLHALERQSFKDFETIVIIDGSTDGTKAFLEEQTFDLDLLIFEHANQGRANIRNKGVALAKGKILIFYDDDMLPESDSVQRHIDFHLSYNDAICGGNQLEDIREARTDFDRYRCDLRERWLKKYNSGLNLLTKENIFLTAANFSVAKKVFIQLGMFDKNFQDAEDYIFSHKAISKNIRLFFDKENIAWHNDFCQFTDYINRRRQYTKNFIFLSESFPGLFNEKVKASQPSFAKKSFYNFFSQKWLVLLIDNDLLIFIPKKLRYLIYEFVITSLGVVFTSKSLPLE